MLCGDWNCQSHVEEDLPEPGPGLGPGLPASGSGPGCPSGFEKRPSSGPRQQLSPPRPAAAAGRFNVFISSSRGSLDIVSVVIQFYPSVYTEKHITVCLHIVSGTVNTLVLTCWKNWSRCWISYMQRCRSPWSRFLSASSRRTASSVLVRPAETSVSCRMEGKKIMKWDESLNKTQVIIFFTFGEKHIVYKRFCYNIIKSVTHLGRQFVQPTKQTNINFHKKHF